MYKKVEPELAEEDFRENVLKENPIILDRLRQAEEFNCQTVSLLGSLSMKLNPDNSKGATESPHAILDRMKSTKAGKFVDAPKSDPVAASELNGRALLVKDEVVRRLDNFNQVDKKLDHVLSKMQSYGEIEISHLNNRSNKYADKVKRIADALKALGKRKKEQRKIIKASKHQTLLSTLGDEKIGD
jgi:hypothetical protein